MAWPSPAPPCPAPNPASEATLLHDNRDALCLPTSQPSLSTQQHSFMLTHQPPTGIQTGLGKLVDRAALVQYAAACVLRQLCPLIQEKSATPADVGDVKGQTLSAYKSGLTSKAHPCSNTRVCIPEILGAAGGGSLHARERAMKFKDITIQ